MVQLVMKKRCDCGRNNSGTDEEGIVRQENGITNQEEIVLLETRIWYNKKDGMVQWKNGVTN